MIVVVSGYFQILHKGHIDYITSAAKLGRVFAIVNNDYQVKLKGSTPVLIPEDERVKIVSAIKGVEKVFLSIDTDESVVETLKKIRNLYADEEICFANGGDRNPDSANTKEAEYCKSAGIKLLYNVGGDKVNSSSRIVKNLLNEFNAKINAKHMNNYYR